MTDSITREIAGFRFAETVYGDSMQRIALREMGDASRWAEIVAFNNLLPPYISDTAAAPGVLLAGDLIKIPASVTVARADTDPDLVFEIDIKLNPDGTLAFGADGDFTPVAGLDNLKQALRDLLDTEAGELMFHPSYGSKMRRIIGMVSGPTASALAAAYARAALESDSRVQRVISSSALVAGDVITVTAKVEPIVGRIIDITQVL